MTTTTRSLAIAALLAATIAVRHVPTHAAAAVPRCHTGRLYLTVSGSNGAAGHIAVTLRFRSVAPTGCSFYGFPGMQLVSATGQNLTTHLLWGTGSQLPSVPKKTILVQPGGAAYAVFMYADVPTGNETCPVVGYYVVTPPNETTSIVVPAHGATPCGGRISITPIMATSL
jgi:uncharacterized protein DUF4232